MTHFKQLDDAVFGCFKNSPKEKLSETRLFSYATESPQSSIVMVVLNFGLCHSGKMIFVRELAGFDYNG
jgi:hypothetical protein